MDKKYDVCVVGGASIDMTCYDNDEKMTEIFFGGKGSNQAVAAARAGAKTCIVTMLGDDEYTKLIIKNLKKNKVKVFADIVEGQNNDIAKITIVNGDNSIERQGNMIKLFDKSLIEKYKDTILTSKYVVLQNKTSPEFTKALIEFCYDNDIKTVLTPSKPDMISISDKNNLDLLKKVSLICANEKETKIVFNCENVEQALIDFPRQLIVTLGERGLVYNNGERNIFVPSIKTENVVDTTGAGDTFCGNIVANLSNGMSFSEAVEIAQYASAYKIQFKSAQAGMPTKSVLRNFIKKVANKHDVE